MSTSPSASSLAVRAPVPLLLLVADYDSNGLADLFFIKLALCCVTGTGPISPVEHTNRKSFMFNQGHLGMRVELDRDVYFPGDEVKMKLEVSNESVKKARKDPLAFCSVASRRV